MLRSGVDIIEIERIDRAILRHGQRFFDRFFTPRELIDCAGRTPALAARFAAKEAVAKAMGTGIGDIGWKEIEVVNGERREPHLKLHGQAKRLAQGLGLQDLVGQLEPYARARRGCGGGPDTGVRGHRVAQASSADSTPLTPVTPCSCRGILNQLPLAHVSLRERLCPHGAKIARSLILSAVPVGQPVPSGVEGSGGPTNRRLQWP